QQADSGVIFAGTNHGIFYLSSLKVGWLPAAMIYGKRPPESEKGPAPAPVPHPLVGPPLEYDGQLKTQTRGSRRAPGFAGSRYRHRQGAAGALPRDHR